MRHTYLKPRSSRVQYLNKTCVAIETSLSTPLVVPCSVSPRVTVDGILLALTMVLLHNLYAESVYYCLQFHYSVCNPLARLVGAVRPLNAALPF